jgi:hypothetical protein
MLVIADRTALATVEDITLRDLIQARIDALEADGDDAFALAVFVVMQPNDVLSTVEQQLGFALTANHWTDTPYGSPDYTPDFELIEDHGGYYELVYLLGDDGSGVELYVEKHADLHPTLGALCAAYAHQTLDNPD